MKTYGVYRGFNHDIKYQVGFFVSLPDAKAWAEDEYPNLDWIPRSGSLLCGEVREMEGNRTICSIREFEDDIPADTPNSVWGTLK